MCVFWVAWLWLENFLSLLLRALINVFIEKNAVFFFNGVLFANVNKWLIFDRRRMNCTPPTDTESSFRLHSTSGMFHYCPPNIQLFQGKDFCSCYHKSLEQFAVRLKNSRLVILPVLAVAEHIFIWTARPRRGVNSILLAPFRNILTCLLTYRGSVQPRKWNLWRTVLQCCVCVDDVDICSGQWHYSRSLVPVQSHRR